MGNNGIEHVRLGKVFPPTTGFHLASGGRGLNFSILGAFFFTPFRVYFKINDQFFFSICNQPQGAKMGENPPP